MKKWKCLVCGYIHTGEEPPEKCPVCGADKSQFILLEPNEEEVQPKTETHEESDASESIDSEKKSSADISEPESDVSFGRKLIARYPILFNYMTQYHAHPISVHIPNGVLPISVVFAFLAAIFNSDAFATAASINMLFVFFAMPFVLFFGYVDWINRFGGRMTQVFKIKIVCGILVTGLTFILSIWWMAEPDALLNESGNSTLFLLMHLLTLIPAGVAGYYGGILVFRK